MRLIQTLCLTALLTVSGRAQETAAAAGHSSGAHAKAGFTISTVDEFKTDIDSVPCKNAERMSGVKALFVKMGAATDEVLYEDFSNVKNVVVTLPGKTNEKIVIGAHYDVHGDGSCGAIDNWTGVAAIAHLYRTFKSMPQLDKTLVFVAFGKEEEGLVGSHAMANGINKRKENLEYCAMVNIDSLGLTAPQIADSISTKSLTELTESLAKQLEIPISRIPLNGANTDSSSFLDRKIPALSLVALPSNWSSFLHTKNDQAKHVNPVSVYAGYRVALALVAKINDTECQAFRQEKKKDKKAKEVSAAKETDKP